MPLRFLAANDEVYTAFCPVTPGLDQWAAVNVGVPAAAVDQKVPETVE
jgi:hypothetical protein